MRHHSSIKKFGREKNQRKALMASLMRNMIRDTKLKTTLIKAKALRPMIEKMVTKAKVDSLASRRLLTSRLRNNHEIENLFTKVATKYKTRNGGYTRIIKLPNRKLDGAKMAIIEFV
jgi:large subunit ribosomal protein L17